MNATPQETRYVDYTKEIHGSTYAGVETHVEWLHNQGSDGGRGIG